MCVSIGQLVCFHTTMKHESDVNDMIGCLQVQKIYSLIQERNKTIYIYAFRISYFSLLTRKKIIV